MPRRNPIFQLALRCLLASSALLLLLMAALQFLPEWRTKLGLAPQGLAQDHKPHSTIEIVETEADPFEDLTPAPLSGSATGEDIPAPPPFTDQFSEVRSSTIEIDAPAPLSDEEVDEAEALGDVESLADLPPPPAPLLMNEALEAWEQRLSQWDLRHAEQQEARDSRILDQFQQHAGELKKILDRIESTERQVQGMKESVVTTAAESPRIKMEMVREHGEQQFVIEAREASLPELLASLGEAAGVNLLVSPEVTGTVSLHLTLSDAQPALAAVCRIHHLNQKQDGTVTVISREPAIEQIAAKPVHPEMKTKLYRLQYLSGSEIRPYVAAVLTPGLGTVNFASIRERVTRTTYRDPPAAILVKDTPEVIAEVDRLILELDQPLEKKPPKPKPERAAPPSATLARPLSQEISPTRHALPPGEPPRPLLVPVAPTCAAPGSDDEIFLPPIER